MLWHTRYAQHGPKKEEKNDAENREKNLLNAMTVTKLGLWKSENNFDFENIFL